MQTLASHSRHPLFPAARDYFNDSAMVGYLQPPQNPYQGMQDASYAAARGVTARYGMRVTRFNGTPPTMDMDENFVDDED